MSNVKLLFKNCQILFIMYIQWSQYRIAHCIFIFILSIDNINNKITIALWNFLPSCYLGYLYFLTQNVVYATGNVRKHNLIIWNLYYFHYTFYKTTSGLSSNICCRICYLLPLYKYGYLEAFDSKTDKM